VIIHRDTLVESEVNEMKATMKTRAAHKADCACKVCQNVRKAGNAEPKEMKAFRLEAGLYDRARNKAAQEGKKLTPIVEELLRNYLAGQGK
jgi:DNA gyrase inhibitor GyrI